jgi:hypothetical protein
MSVTRQELLGLLRYNTQVIASLQANNDAVIALLSAAEAEPQRVLHLEPETNGKASYVTGCSNEPDTHPQNARIDLASMQEPLRWMCSRCGRRYNDQTLYQPSINDTSPREQESHQS